MKGFKVNRVKYIIFVTDIVTNRVDMTRSIPKWLSGVLEKLELERPELVSTPQLEVFCEEVGLDVPTRVVASRLKERGWFLPTPQQGVWEFIPAEVAGAISSADPLIPVKAFRLANEGIECALTFQSAAWALGLADRVPAQIELAFELRPNVKVPAEISPTVFAWHLSSREAKGVPVLAPESLIVHMAHRPKAVRSWSGALEWLPDVAYEIKPEALVEELDGRPLSTWAKTGYLLQGLRPDAAQAIALACSPKHKVRFGPSQKAIRNDERWMVSDSILPFDPRSLEAVK